MFILPDSLENRARDNTRPGRGTKEAGNLERDPFASRPGTGWRGRGIPRGVIFGPDHGRGLSFGVGPKSTA